jgi:hypothetical protein
MAWAEIAIPVQSGATNNCKAILGANTHVRKCGERETVTTTIDHESSQQ